MINNLIGQKFGRLTVLSRCGSATSGDAIWECGCECGKKTRATGYQLRANKKKSCGCYRASLRNSLTHGMSKSPEHKIWRSMLGRCGNPRQDKGNNYCNRGISVCPRWQSFENFYADMGSRPSSSHSIDRIDPNGNYEPSNCRWATLAEQAVNKRNTRYVAYEGQIIPLIEAVRKSGTPLHYETIWARIQNGWPIDCALFEPQHPSHERLNQLRRAA